MLSRPLPILAAAFAVCLCAGNAVAAPPWCSTPLAKWTEGASFDQDYDLQPPFGAWEEQEGALVARGTADRWSTKLYPADLGPNAKVALRFTVDASSGKALQLPGGCVRWGFYWGENLPGWDLAVVLSYKDPLDFCRVLVSASRNELGLWDAASGFLQLIPCDLGVGRPHELDIMVLGPHYRVLLDGELVMDYWNRSVTHDGGQPGLAVYNSTVQFERFEAEDVRTLRAETMPAHKPDFHFRPCGPTAFGAADGLILFDGNEPISVYSVSPQGNAGTLFQDMVRLKPGWRSAYYTWIGPGINYGVNGSILALVGKFPEAFKVEKEGEQLVFTFRTEAPDLAYAEQTCTVRYDTDREVYRYEYSAHTQWTTQEPYTLYYMELTDPLTYNNRTPGPEVVNRWDPTGHQWWVLRDKDGAWVRSPLIDYLSKYNGHPMAWPTSSDFLYPDPVACPAWETTLKWEQPDQRSYDVGLCHWGYDFHHTEEGHSVTLPVGTQRDYSLTLTALPAAEARKIFEKTEVAPKVASSTDKYPVFNAAGTTFDLMSTRQAPTSTMVWDTGTVDNSVGRTDKHSLRVDGPDTAKVQMYQYAFEQWAEQWWLRGWFKAEGVGGRGLLARVKYSYARDPEELFYLGGLQGADKWTYFSFLTTAPKQRDCTNLEFELDGPGKVWLDDIAFSAVQEGQTPETTPFVMSADLEPRTDMLIDLSPTEAPGTGVYDESRNGHALQLKGPTWVTEEGHGFLRFDGQDDYAYLPLKSVLEPRDPPPGTTGSEIYKPLFRLDTFTYEIWARPRPAEGRMVLLNYLRCSPYAFFDPVPGEPEECRFVYQNNIFHGQKISLEKIVPYDEWLHVVATHGDGKVILYLNGEKAGEVTYDPEGPGFAFFAYTWRYDIGSFLGGKGNNFAGDLGPFRLYTRALTEEEAKESYTKRW